MSNALTIARVTEARNKFAAGEFKVLDVTLFCAQTGERVVMTFDSLNAIDGLLHDLRMRASFKTLRDRNDGIFQSTRSLS